MGKTDAIIESIVRKIERTGLDLAAASGKKMELTVGGGMYRISFPTLETTITFLCS